MSAHNYGSTGPASVGGFGPHTWGVPPPSSKEIQVELLFSCQNLRDMDILSKSDPQVVLYQKNQEQNWKELGRTEKVSNNLNPCFAQPIPVIFKFEMRQDLRIRIFDIDDNGQSIGMADFLGELELPLGQIISSRTLTRDLTHSRFPDCGTITIEATEMGGLHEIACFKFEGVGLDKKDLFGKSDPYYELGRQNVDGSFTTVYRSETINYTLSPKWKQHEINVKRLCLNPTDNPDAPILFSCYDHDDDGSHDFIGYFTITLTKLRDRNADHVNFKLINPKKLEKKKYENSGIIKIVECRVEKTYSFLDYIMGGLQLNCTVAIDFTGSNGDPQTPRSLHYMASSEGNQYQQAWLSIGQIMQEYDADKLFPAFGFGGALPPHGQVSFEFALNGDAANPLCAGVTGVLDAYKTALLNVGLSGPTNCAPMIRHVSKLAVTAAQSRSAQNYYVLLILTDGQFTDIYDCIGAIVEAADYPMSIIIIGVGEADFTDMERLDADKKALQFNGRKSTRDIVQFVPFNKFISSPSALPAAVLAELPRQVEEYYRKRRITPFYKVTPE